MEPSPTKGTPMVTKRTRPKKTDVNYMKANFKFVPDATGAFVNPGQAVVEEFKVFAPPVKALKSGTVKVSEVELEPEDEDDAIDALGEKPKEDDPTVPPHLACDLMMHLFRSNGINLGSGIANSQKKFDDRVEMAEQKELQHALQKTMGSEEFKNLEKNVMYECLDLMTEKADSQEFAKNENQARMNAEFFEIFKIEYCERLRVNDVACMQDFVLALADFKGRCGMIACKVDEWYKFLVDTVTNGKTPDDVAKLMQMTDAHLLDATAKKIEEAMREEMLLPEEAVREDSLLRPEEAESPLRVQNNFADAYRRPILSAERATVSAPGFSTYFINRRLSDTGDVALPALRSAAATPALPQEDGITLRDTARRLDEGEGAEANVKNYKEKLELFVGCIATYERSVESTLEDMVNAEPEDAVLAFYSKTTLVLTFCHNTVTHPAPSECPVDMFAKEVYFMFGVRNEISPNYGQSKTSSYVDVGMPAASRLDRLMNAITELFAAA